MSKNLTFFYLHPEVKLQINVVAKVNGGFHRYVLRQLMIIISHKPVMLSVSF